jgi:hypothetical protein
MKGWIWIIILVLVTSAYAGDYITKDYIDPLTIERADQRYCKTSNGCSGITVNVTRNNVTDEIIFRWEP